MKNPEPRPPRKTARQQRTEVCRAEWEKNHEKPVRKHRSKLRGARGLDLIIGLEREFEATGDQAFDDALRAIHRRGRDRKSGRNTARVEVPYLAQVDFLVRHGKLEGRNLGERRRVSTREACECIVAEFWLPGLSFESVVERLRQDYLRSPFYRQRVNFG